ncbi:hypothetical protein K432DRAFT_377735 [Lepidopterella palustris CBS 459.81]|uniref:Uncharacterized protein n=1 Tax=Lepidopterella palustris CBS 459.81 TaxID=1314670 RepID=A0A8E2JJW2_9PEZI|nr:hypothetical protein K432DRAFT_377735 [Lepidopterella palustris CBS 459.81]
MFSLQNLLTWVLTILVIPRLNFLSPSTRSLLTLFGPFLLPRFLAFIASIRAAQLNTRIPICPTPPKVQRALHILFVFALVCLVSTLPYFSPENVFLKTQSRLQIPTDVLFARLAFLRPLTPLDETLRSKFVNVENRLLYLLFGPDTLATCPFCASDDKSTYLAYALPKLLTPHIVHLAVLGAATSSVLCGPEGSRWRTHATIGGLALLVAEIWYTSFYDHTRNKSAKVLWALDFAFWRIRMVRSLAFAAADAVLGLCLWLTSTNRWLASPPPLAERLESTTKIVEDSLMKLRALGVVKNSLVRDKGLREAVERYWIEEGEVMSEVVQEREVLEEINKVVANKDMSEVEGKAGEVADGILMGLENLQTSVQVGG